LSLNVLAGLQLCFTERHQELAALRLVDDWLVAATSGIVRCLKQIQPFLDVVDGFPVRPTLQGSLTGPLPVRNRLCPEAAFSVVMGD
jgi:hypothetical protein